MGFRTLLAISLLISGTTAFSLPHLGKGATSDNGGKGNSNQPWIPYYDAKNSLPQRHEGKAMKGQKTSPQSEIIPIISSVLERNIVPVPFNVVPIRQPLEGPAYQSFPPQGWLMGPMVFPSRYPVLPPESFQPLLYFAPGEVEGSNQIYQKTQNAKPESWQQNPEHKGVVDLFSSGMYAPMQFRLPFPPIGPPYPIIFLVSRPVPFDLIQTESKEVQAQVPNVEQKKFPSSEKFRQDVSQNEQKLDQIDMNDHLGIPKPTEKSEEGGNKTDPTVVVTTPIVS